MGIMHFGKLCLQVATPRSRRDKFQQPRALAPLASVEPREIHNVHVFDKIHTDYSNSD